MVSLVVVGLGGHSVVESLLGGEGSVHPSIVVTRGESANRKQQTSG